MKKQSKQLLKIVIGALVLIGVFIGLLFLSSDPTTIDGSDISRDEWVKGNADSAVTIVEYSDFQCPACAAREPLVQTIMQEFGDHVRFVYRHFPLRSIHPNAQLSAQAAEAAGQQGQFWEMHNAIFANQSSWENLDNAQAKLTFQIYAQQLGLDAEQFNQALESDAVKQAIDDDVSAAISAGVNSTPTFFLNGEKINFYNYDEIRQTLRDAIEAAQ